ncbi:hypothetical protein C1H46_022232 [Malus baccata]|uniref:Origin recognition complex subunit 1 n=1 Tax=Malus baccata TaxID=106549 RepID=A0A540M0C8_MALBA|nr:hypothetical protein C1H46_022232 [Malus baccata]
MIKCDDCLGGFNLKCLKPPLKDVPEGDWICGFCEARKLGKAVQLPTPPEGKKLVRTLREKLLFSDLWAAHIESIWKEVDGRYWCRVHWYIIPKETAAGRQPHNLWREIYRTNDFADIEVAPKDVESWQNMLKDDDEAGSDQDWKVGKDSDFDSEEDMDYDEESIKSILAKPFRAHELVANSQKGWFFGLQKIGMKKIPEHVAAISGDARCALEICRREAEITDYRLKKLTSTPNDASEGKTLGGMAEVEAAIQEMFQAPHIQVMKFFSKLSKIFLTAMVYELYI